MAKIVRAIESNLYPRTIEAKSTEKNKALATDRSTPIGLE